MRDIVDINIILRDINICVIDMLYVYTNEQLWQYIYIYNVFHTEIEASVWWYMISAHSKYT